MQNTSLVISKVHNVYGCQLIAELERTDSKFTNKEYRLFLKASKEILESMYAKGPDRVSDSVPDFNVTISDDEGGSSLILEIINEKRAFNTKEVFTFMGNALLLLSVVKGS